MSDFRTQYRAATKTFIIVLAILSASVFCSGQGRTVERMFISTDRPYYAAGDKIYCSAFCLTPEGELSGFSAVSYLELYSADGHSVTGKIALTEGRGAGSIDLPSDLPTGNYRLIAYTAVNHNEEGFDYGSFSKTVSVYNTSSASRVEGGVEIIPDMASGGQEETGTGDLDITLGESSEGGLSLFMNSGKQTFVSVSIYHDEHLPVYDTGSMKSFLSSIKKPQGFLDNSVPEYDGEIVRIQIEPSEGTIADLSGKDVFISTPGSISDIYATPLGKDGVAEYFTTNIFGNKDMAIEIKDFGKPFSFSFVNPFVGKGPKDGIPVMKISQSMEKAISRMGESMQVVKMFDADTLYDYLPSRSIHFTGKDRVSYILDDYTRFSTMREIFIEYLFDITTRRNRDKGIELVVSCNDEVRKNSYVPSGESLIMIDGVPVFDHNLIYEYDPALVKRIDVYPYVYFIGGRSYDGMADFVTFKGNMPSFNFGPEVKITDFQGAGVPVAITGKNFPAEYPNIRETIYWNPLLTLEGGESTPMEVVLPAYSGDFKIVVEGIDCEGNPIYRTAYFETE